MLLSLVTTKKQFKCNGFTFNAGSIEAIGDNNNISIGRHGYIYFDVDWDYIADAERYQTEKGRILHEEIAKKMRLITKTMLKHEINGGDIIEFSLEDYNRLKRSLHLVVEGYLKVDQHGLYIRQTKNKSFSISQDEAIDELNKKMQLVSDINNFAY